MEPTNNVINLAEVTDDGALWTVEQMLLDALNELREGNGVIGRPEAKKAILLVLDDSDGKYHWGFHCCGAKKSEFVALLTIAAKNFIMELGY